MMNERVTSIMTTNPVTLNPENNLTEVQSIFQSKRIHHIPVVQDDTLVGIVTTYDLWKNDIPFAEYKNVSVKEIMTTNIAKIGPEDKVGTAAELFLDNRFHALPVVEDNKLIGIVTSFDVLKYEFKKEYKEAILYKEILEKPNAFVA